MSLDSLYIYNPSKEFSDSLFDAISEVSNHTNEFGGLSLWVTIITVISSIITIVGLVQLIRAIRDRKISKECQKKILLDLIRHNFTTNTHVEAIRCNMGDSSVGKTLKEGILERFCFLDSDLELSGMRFTDKSFEILHSIRELMRNYNSVAMIAERHFADPSCSDEIRVEDLDEIWDRAIELSKKILDYAEDAELGLSTKDANDYIRQYYMKPDRIPKWKKEGRLNMTVSIPDRTKRPYYDKNPFDLTDIMDACIRCRINKAFFR